MDFLEGPRMDAGYAWIVCAWIAFHMAAVAAAYGTRVAAGSRLENLAQLICFAAMVLVGAAIWACQQSEAGSWGLSAFTLMAMVLTAVVDFRKLHDGSHTVGHRH
jgi:TM2 domain-containing membrane protein YozV